MIMKKIIILLACLVFSASQSFSQYTVQDRDLVKTTFTRTFDRKIELKYLHSTKNENVKAALLSIAESGDTSFNSDIEKLNFDTFGKYICFTLEEIGPSDNTAQFLFSKLKENKNNTSLIRDILDAIGKTGDLNSYRKLIGMYLNGLSRDYPGISLSLFNFYSRKIGNAGQTLNILFNELNNFRNSPERYFEAAFTICRIGVPFREIHKVAEELNKAISEKAISLKESPYYASAAACLLKSLTGAKYFPYNPVLKSELLNTNNYNIKLEAVKAISFYNFSNLNEFIEYLKSLDNRNPNIAEEFAASLKNIRVNKFLSDFLKGFIQKALSNRKYSKTVKGTLLLSYISLYKPQFDEVIKRYSGAVPGEYLYRACSEYQDSQQALDFLIDHYKSAGLKDKTGILSVLMEVLHNNTNNKGIQNVIEDALNADSPSLISIAADGIDSLFIKTANYNLQKIILAKVKKYVNSPGYYESMESLADLSKRIDGIFYKIVITELSKSKIYSVKRYADLKLNIHVSDVKKDTSLFNSLWVNAFKYKGATIKTTVGTFKIKFLPGLAPVTVGNFCVLAGEKFFNGTIFHRVVPGFVIQGGDPTGTGWGGPGYDIVSEFSPAVFVTGAVGIASAGKDTEGSQWFVMTGIYPHLNGRYTLFGNVTDGQNIINLIKQGDRIISISPY